MTVGNVSIRRHEKWPNWYILTFTSRKDSIGQTSVEMLVSEEELRHLHNLTNDAILKKDK